MGWGIAFISSFEHLPVDLRFQQGDQHIRGRFAALNVF
jgi:hypothetical protein